MHCSFMVQITSHGQIEILKRITMQRCNAPLISDPQVGCGWFLVYTSETSYRDVVEYYAPNIALAHTGISTSLCSIGNSVGRLLFCACK